MQRRSLLPVPPTTPRITKTRNHEDKRNHFAQDFDCVISNCVVMFGDISLPINFPKGRVVPKLFVVIGGIVTTLKRELASFAVWQWAKQLQNKR